MNMSSAAASLPVLSFVLPAYNEAPNLEPMAARLRAAAEAAGEPESYEIVWVNDGSTDATGEVLETMAARDPHIRPIHFSRNFGHMAALTAGIEAARATGAGITLDSDGQHPPELIPEMVRLWKGGVDIVQRLRRHTAGEPLLKRASSRGFYLLLNCLAELEIPEGSADFRLLDRQVVDALNSLPERVRFLRGLVHWVGFRMETLPYEAPARLAGNTKYNAKKMLVLALGGISSFSVRPLRITFLLGMIILVLAALYGVYVVIAYLSGKPLAAGWASLLLATMVLSGIQLLTLGVASEYLGRIYEETKHRPVYIIRKPRKDSKT